MCSRVNPELRTRMYREMAEEFRKWFREWRRRNAVTLATLGLKGAVTTPTDAPRGRRQADVCPCPPLPNKEGVR